MSNSITFVKDGDKWCAMPPGFVNLQESEAGFGDTVEQAEISLLRSLYKRARGGYGCPNKKCCYCDDYDVIPATLPEIGNE